MYYDNWRRTLKIIIVINLNNKSAEKLAKFLINLAVNAIKAINQSHLPEKIYKHTILVEH